MHCSARFTVALWVLAMGLWVGAGLAQAQVVPDPEIARDAAPIVETAWASTASGAPSSSPAAFAGGDGGHDVLADFETEVTRLVNVERARVGCPALTLHPVLHQVADAHSRDMADRNYVGHVNPAGENPGDRVNKTSYEWAALGENVAAGYESPQSVVAGWMGSEGHRANILNCAYLDTGVGYVYAAGTKYGHYWTQLLGLQLGARAPDPEPVMRQAAFLPLTVKPARVR